MAMQDTPLPLFRGSENEYWFAEEAKMRRDEAAYDYEADFDDIEGPTLADLVFIENNEGVYVPNDLPPVDYHDMYEDYPSRLSNDDYLEENRIGGMSMSEAASYYGGEPAVLGGSRYRSTYYPSSFHTKTTGNAKRDYRTSVNVSAKEYAVKNRELLTSFLESI